MNLPNKLTVLRIILTFVFMAFFYMHGVASKVLALVTFLAASLTDALDGYLAKKYNQITNFGRLMDPVADKILVLAALLAFVERGIIPVWMLVIIVFREMAVTGLRVFAFTKGKVIQADGGGKHKTVWQLLAITVILLFFIFREGGAAGFGFWNYHAEVLYKNFIFVIMLVAIAMTMASGISYFVKNKEVYSDEEAH